MKPKLINYANECSNNLDNGSRLWLQNCLILFIILPYFTYFTRIVTRPNSETCTSYHLKIKSNRTNLYCLLQNISPTLFLLVSSEPNFVIFDLVLHMLSLSEILIQWLCECVYCSLFVCLCCFLAFSYKNFQF